MEMKKFAAGAITAGALGLGALGAGIGLAHADPYQPVPNPSDPGNSGHADNPGWNPGGNQNYQGDQDDQGNQPWHRGDDRGFDRGPGDITGPGVNAGGPGYPLPPGHGFLPPPGHGGPMPQDGIPYSSVPSWVNTPVAPPVGAPLQPPIPDWANGLPVVWNPDRAVWGVWNAANSVFEPF